MAISPWRQGQLLPIWQATVTDDSGAAVPLTGISSNAFSLTIFDTVSQTARSGAGSFSVTNATAGQLTYTWAAADVAQLGTFTLTIGWTVSGQPEYSDPTPWVVKAVGAP